MNKNTKKGYYKPINPNKYVGNVKQIIYRSGWEKKFCKFLDIREDVIKWASEPFAIPYISPIDQKLHRYFPDFLIKVKDKNKKVEIILIEIKPYVQTQPPRQRKRKTAKYLTEIATFAVNEAKWDAAELYCQDKGWQFKIITEKDINF